MASPESLRVIKRRIEQFVQLPGRIIDPYCGTGRMLALPRRIGYDVVGVDCSPIAILAARVAHQSIRQRRLSRDFETLLAHFSKCRGTLDRFDFDVGQDELFWFKDQSFVDLRNILESVDSVSSSNGVRRVFWLALVNTVREVSYLREQEYKLHRMNSPMRSKHVPSTHKSFFSHARRLLNLLVDCRHPPGKYRFLLGDVAESSIRPGSVNALVTSPPYGDSASTVGYGQFSRVPLLLLRHSERFSREYGSYNGVSLDGLCLGGIRCARLGATEGIPPSLPSDLSPAMRRFSEGYFARLALCSVLLKHKATCCLVLGNRTHRGQVFPLIETTIEFLTGLGFSLVDRHDRLLSRKRLPRSMQHRVNGASIDHDSINYESVITMTRW